MSEKHAVTGAFGYTGSYIARFLLEAGHEVITLTNSPDRESPMAGKIEAFPFNFDHPEKLTESLRGVRVLYNTYWVRFNHKHFTHAVAINNIKTLFDCAKAAGVEKIVHVSITNPDVHSELEYFSGKGELEEHLKSLGMPYSILRPTVIFGDEDILVNNMAWGLRHAPIMAIFGDGSYRVQPIFVEDFARLAVREGQHLETAIINAIGPETFTYRELVECIAEGIGKRRPIIGLPAGLAYRTFTVMGWFMGDTILTRDEIDGLMADMIYADAPPVGTTRLSEWIKDNADTLGKRYANELRRRKDRKVAYQINP